MKGHASRAAQCVADAAETTFSDHPSLPEENDLNAVFVAESLRRFRGGCADRRYRWDAYALKRKTEESLVKADILVLLQMDTRDFAVEKGMLIQAKLAANLGSAWKTLQEQCATMQEFTRDAIALVWDQPVWTMSATEVGAWKRPPERRETSSRLVRTTFEPFFDCWAGDPGIAAAFRAGNLPTRWLLALQVAADDRPLPAQIQAPGYTVSETPRHE